MTWTPVSDPPLLLEDDFYFKKSDPVLVYTSYGTMIVATLQQWEEDDVPVWYSSCSERESLSNSVKFWRPLPKPPKDQP